MVRPMLTAHSVSKAMLPLARSPRVRKSTSSRRSDAACSLSRSVFNRPSIDRARSMMRASRLETAPIMPATAVSRKTGAMESWIPWATVSGSRKVGMRGWGGKAGGSMTVWIRA